MQVAPGQEVNGRPITQLLSNNLLYAESDHRGGNQVQTLFSPSFDLSGHTGIVLVFNSAYEQNQDSMAGVEYSVDSGVTWLPVVYMLDDQGGARTSSERNGGIDVSATLKRPGRTRLLAWLISNWMQRQSLGGAAAMHLWTDQRRPG